MTETLHDMLPPSGPPLGPPPRRLRRSRNGRVAAGVSAGLGDYFALDPVLFRVLFATSAFFGGAGILAYLLAWGAIPDAGTEHAPIDSAVAALRRRRVPLWAVAIVGALVLWLVAFSWWAPGPFVPVLAFLALVVFFVLRRDLRTSGRPADAVAEPVAGAVTQVDLTKPTVAADPAVPADPGWVGDGRAWLRDARTAARERRRRAWPIRVGTLVTLVLTLAVLGVIDGVTGISLQSYFWAALGVIGLGVLAGVVTRRNSLSLLPLVVAAAIGAVAFAGTHARLQDGFGQRVWTPVDAPAASYRLAFGQGVLDLRSLHTQSKPRRIDITVGAGRVLIIVPKSLPVTVQANAHFGTVETRDNGVYEDAERVNGAGISQTVAPLATATGQPVLIDVHLADGDITVDRR